MTEPSSSTSAQIRQISVDDGANAALSIRLEVARHAVVACGIAVDLDPVPPVRVPDVRF